MTTLRVMAIPGEPTRFRVESNSLECLGCGDKDGNPTLFNRRLRPDLRIGGKCPRCGGQLDVRFHVVDIAGYDGNGECACEWFGFTLRKKLEGMEAAHRGLGLCRCHHIKAAREFALDVALRAHDYERHRSANGQREEDQP